MGFVGPQGRERVDIEPQAQRRLSLNSLTTILTTWQTHSSYKICRYAPMTTV